MDAKFLREMLNAQNLAAAEEMGITIKSVSIMADKRLSGMCACGAVMLGGKCIRGCEDIKVVECPECGSETFEGKCIANCTKMGM